MAGMGGVFVFRALWFGGYDFLKRYALKQND